MRRVCVALLALLVLGSVPAGGAERWNTTGGVLDGKNVEVTPDPEEPRILKLSFDSGVLGQRVDNVVWLPESSEPLPVVYYLHGTIATRTHPVVEDLERDLIAAGVPLGYPLGPPRGPAVGPNTGPFRDLLDTMRFAVVAPDAGELPWCPACNWADTPNGGGVYADTFVNTELAAVVEAVFDVRTDRGGRAVVGHSMGGGGAIINGFRHPDRYAFVGSSSGTLTVLDEAVSTTQGRWLYWNRTQGFAPAVVDEISLRNINATDLAPNMVGTGTEVVAVIGDACLEHPDEGSCEGKTPVNDSGGFYQELYQRYGNNDPIAPRLIELGVPLTYIRREGYHGIFSSTFRRYFLDRLHAIFASAVPDPARFAYKNADPAFTAWGYGVEVARPNKEFLHMLDARPDGRSLVLAGTGTVHLVLPPAFTPGASYRVVRTPAGGEPVTDVLTADPQGHISFTFELGPERTIDERRTLVEQGQFQFPQVRVEVFDA